MTSRHVLMIDNFDSFTFNLVYDLRQLGCTVETWRNDTPLPFLIDRAAAHAATFVLSPGPGSPASAGICTGLVRAAAGRFGVLGICLGHQVIVEAFGGRVTRAREIVHGQASVVRCARHELFAGLPQALQVARYHSLAASELPDELVSIAIAGDGTVMAVAHRSLPVLGMQFHPESILTANGPRLLANALDVLDCQKEHRDAITA